MCARCHDSIRSQAKAVADSCQRQRVGRAAAAAILAGRVLIQMRLVSFHTFESWIVATWGSPQAGPLAPGGLGCLLGGPPFVPFRGTLHSHQTTQVLLLVLFSHQQHKPSSPFPQHRQIALVPITLARGGLVARETPFSRFGVPQPSKARYAKRRHSKLYRACGRCAPASCLCRLAACRRAGAQRRLLLHSALCPVNCPRRLPARWLAPSTATGVLSIGHGRRFCSTPSLCATVYPQGTHRNPQPNRPIKTRIPLVTH